MEKPQGEEQPTIAMRVSRVALSIFVKYLNQRFLSYEETIAVLDFAWEIIFLSGYFGFQKLVDLVSGVFTVCFHRLENLTEEDYLYSFLYSVLYPMPVLREKLFAMLMAIIGRNPYAWLEHPVIRTLEFDHGPTYNRIRTMLQDYPNYFSNCQATNLLHALIFCIVDCTFTNKMDCWILHRGTRTNY